MVVAMGSGGGGGGAMAAGFAGGAADKRFRVDFYASAQNILNRTNYTSYSGTLTSPLFGQPTAAGTPRRIQLGARFSF
jgi:outer membrane receptor protein involved in Fe transport